MTFYDDATKSFFEQAIAPKLAANDNQMPAPPRVLPRALSERGPAPEDYSEEQALYLRQVDDLLNDALGG